MSRGPVVALWVTIAYLGVVLAATLSRSHFRYSHGWSWDLGEFWILAGLVSIGFAGLVAVAVWLARSAKGPGA